MSKVSQVSRGPDVDLVLYGKRGLLAFEVKRPSKMRGGELDGLIEFKNDYPMAKCFFLSGENVTRNLDGITQMPLEKFLLQLHKYL